MTWGRKEFTESNLLDLGRTLKSAFFSKSLLIKQNNDNFGLIKKSKFLFLDPVCYSFKHFLSNMP